MHEYVNLQNVYCPNPSLGNLLTSGDASVNYSPILNIAKYKELGHFHCVKITQFPVPTGLHYIMTQAKQQRGSQGVDVSLAVSIMLLTEKPRSHSKYRVAGATQPWASNESDAETKRKKNLLCLAVTKRLQCCFC